MSAAPPRALMLVSAVADSRLRKAVADGVRPRPEYLLLEQEHGVELLDWSRLPGSHRGRTTLSSAVHATAALRHAGHHNVVLSDGEHIRIPLALAMRVLGVTTPHVVIGHHLTTRPKARLLRRLKAHRAMTRIIVHSHLQAQLAERELGVPPGKLVYEPYYADTEFWRPAEASAEERLVVTAGREHRDYATLAEACASADARVFVAAGSVHSPGATTSEPAQWPSNFDRGFADYRTLRDLYARAAVVVVPLLETDFQAGVTTVLEAMSMAKAVVVTATKGRSQVVHDGLTGVCVPPGDAAELGDAVRFLLEDRAARRRLGDAARDAAVAYFGVEGYARRLVGHMAEVASAVGVAA